MNWIATVLGWINQYLNQLIVGQQKIEKQLANQQVALAAMQVEIAQIIKYVSPRPAADFELTIQNSEGEQMAKTAARGKLKINVVDTGTLKATLTVLDDVGIPTVWDGAAVPVYTTSNPAISLAPAADGMSAAITITQPPALAAGIVVTVSGTNGRGNAVSADNSADPINITAGPAGSFVLGVA
jgi:hypothetical protein